MEYKNNNGKVLYGYSQIDLESNTRAIKHQTKIIKTAVIVGGSIATAFFFLCIFVLYQIMRYNLFTAFVTRCVC